MLDSDVVFLCQCAAAIMVAQAFGMVILFAIMARMNRRHSRQMREINELKCRYCRMTRLEEGV